VSGIFAQNHTRTDEAVNRIPWNIILKPSPELGHGVCAAIDSALDVFRNVPADQTPYKNISCQSTDWSSSSILEKKKTVLIGHLSSKDYNANIADTRHQKGQCFELATRRDVETSEGNRKQS
jgi:hypothetical protein